MSSGATTVMTTQQLEKLLQGLDRNDKAKLNALTLLSHTEGEKEMMRAIEARLRGAEDKRKMPYWLLVDSLIKNTNGPLREEIIKKLQSFLSKLVPWGVSEHVSTYIDLFHSWEGVLDPDTMQIVEEVIKQSLIEHRRATATRKGKDELRKSRVFKTLLQDAIAAAAEAPVNHDENILVPVSDTLGPQAEDAVETASEEPATQDDAAPAESGGRDASMEPQLQTTVAHEVPTSIAGQIGECDIPSLVLSLYAKPTQCDRSGIRFHESFDMEAHKDHLYRLRTNDETKKKCRVWFKVPSEWSNITTTGFGNMVFNDRGAAMTKQASKRSVTAEPIKIEDVSQDIKCHVCGEPFDKKVIGGDWYILEALKTDVPDPAKAWQKYVAFSPLPF
eukprot:TRINITY_DN2900_c0_g1_i1.p1 TRINITY_DN2900_c0_g1~~TRINITY_DN2900_c0_g1_i1.p1  ORF type:complete len:389 (+),score=65.94 TRINITY_DN2900_c0_g1_i1:72-1238(+)